MEVKMSLLSSQQATTGAYTERRKFSPQSPNLFPQDPS